MVALEVPGHPPLLPADVDLEEECEEGADQELEAARRLVEEMVAKINGNCLMEA